MLETPSIRRYQLHSFARDGRIAIMVRERRERPVGDNVFGADNQQERLGSTESRILRGYTPNTESGFREDIVRPPWRHGEPGGTETTWPLDHVEQAELPIER